MSAPTKPEPTITVWGLAAGKGTTSEAARGAFTARVYRLEDAEKHRDDWQSIVSVSKGGKL